MERWGQCFNSPSTIHAMKDVRSVREREERGRREGGRERGREREGRGRREGGRGRKRKKEKKKESPSSPV